MVPRNPEIDLISGKGQIMFDGLWRQRYAGNLFVGFDGFEMFEGFEVSASCIAANIQRVVLFGYT